MSELTPRYKRWILGHQGEYSSIREVLLANRSLSAADVSDSPEILHDPLAMAGMAEAVERVGQALDEGEKIVVYGDYDVDGVTSTALLLDFFDRAGGDAAALLPDRYRDGYGLRPPAVERALEMDAGLLVTADNGVSAFEAVELARSRSLDVVIVDHHLPHDRLPAATAVVDPNRADCAYPFKGLAAVGLAFKLVQALSAGRMPGDERRRYLNGLLDLVALGTVADVAPMVGENRLLTRRGIQVLAGTGRPGLKALMGAAGVGDKPVDTVTIGFYLGPRLNSAGRLASAELALDLLRTGDPQTAVGLAAELDALNRRRRELQDEGLAEAEEQVRSKGLDRHRFLVVRGDSWHLGVVGLIAGRLAESFGRPTLACTAARGDGSWVGSARSAAGYDIGAAIFRCEEHLSEFGGHAAAAGLTVSEANFEALRSQLQSDAERLLPEAALEPELEIDLVLASADISLDTVKSLKSLAPFGSGNEAPIFMAEDCRVAWARAIGKDGSHLKLRLETGAGDHDAVWWRQGELAGTISAGARVDAAFGLEANTWQGRTRVQMRLEDLRPAAL